jgi:tRNA threonylcarbamoyladenosine biosynthesis protein TsaB
MLVLALDTTTRAGSCALSRDGAVVREVAGDARRSAAEHLPGDLMALLEQEQVPLESIDVFAVAIGPGSFTGLRVGIATMQGLAFAMGKPLVGVSALDALERAGRALLCGPASDSRSERRDPPDTIATWIDAWRGEIYAALYQGGREIETPTVEHPSRVLARLSAHDGPPRRVCFVGDGAATFTELIRNALRDEAVIAEPPMPLLAGTIAQIATDAARAGHRPSPDAIRPLYVRRTDAELARDARTGR